jgi:large subunit ribosomal protein L7/L12
MPTMEEVVQALGNMSVMQVIALTKELEQKWGVKAEPQAVQVQDNAPKQEVVEQTEFTVILASVPADKKMSCLKMVREITILGLKEAKEFVESVPKAVKEGCSKAEAEEYKAKLVEAGGVVEVK